MAWYKCPTNLQVPPQSQPGVPHKAGDLHIYPGHMNTVPQSTEAGSSPM